MTLAPCRGAYSLSGKYDKILLEHCFSTFLRPAMVRFIFFPITRVVKLVYREIFRQIRPLTSSVEFFEVGTSTPKWRKRLGADSRKPAKLIENH